MPNQTPARPADQSDSTELVAFPQPDRGQAPASTISAVDDTGAQIVDHKDEAPPASGDPVTAPPPEVKVTAGPDAKTRFVEALGSLAESESKISKGGFFANSSASVVARLVNLVTKLSQSDDGEAFYQQALLAATLLRNNPDSASTVSVILDDIDYSTSRNSPVYAVMRGLVQAVLILLIGGVLLLGIFSFAYGGAYGLNWQQTVEGTFVNFCLSPIIIASSFGMLGSVVSILLRLSEFEAATRRSRQFLRMTGFMLPFVGAIFAGVTCAIFASGIINFSFANEGGNLQTIRNPYFYVVIGFLSGFSERFTRGLLGTAESVIASSAQRVSSVATVTNDAGELKVSETRSATSTQTKGP
jgi:hypothetical protein